MTSQNKCCPDCDHRARSVGVPRVVSVTHTFNSGWTVAKSDNSVWFLDNMYRGTWQRLPPIPETEGSPASAGFCPCCGTATATCSTCGGPLVDRKYSGRSV